MVIRGLVGCEACGGKIGVMTSCDSRPVMTHSESWQCCFCSGDWWGLNEDPLQLDLVFLFVYWVPQSGGFPQSQPCRWRWLMCWGFLILRVRKQTLQMGVVVVLGILVLRVCSCSPTLQVEVFEVGLGGFGVALLWGFANVHPPHHPCVLGRTLVPPVHRGGMHMPSVPQLLGAPGWWIGG